MFNIFRKKQGGKTMNIEDMTEDEILAYLDSKRAKKPSEEQAQDDRVDESVATQEKATDSVDSQTDEDRVDESEGEQKAVEESHGDEKADIDLIDQKLQPILERLAALESGSKEQSPEDRVKEKVGNAVTEGKAIGDSGNDDGVSAIIEKMKNRR